MDIKITQKDQDDYVKMLQDNLARIEDQTITGRNTYKETLKAR